jgi:uncharacterized protein (TIGR00251 family)
MSPLSTDPVGVRLRVHVQPRASRTELAGQHGDALKVRVAAPPVGGAANDALVRFLADVLRVARSAVSIEAGGTGRAKVVRIAGVGLADAARHLGL